MACKQFILPSSAAKAPSLGGHVRARSLAAALTLGAGVALSAVAAPGSSATAQELEWATQAGGGELDQGWAIAADGAGDAVVTGGFHGTATFGEGEANETTLTAAGYQDVFVAEYGPDGALLWATQAGGVSDSDAGYGVAVDGAGNFVVTGYFWGSATFGEGEANETTLDGHGRLDLFVAKWLVGPEDTLQVLIANMEALVTAGKLEARVGSRLTAMLDRAQDNLARGRLDAACGQIGAFINQVEALVRSRRLIAEDAATLLTPADAVREQLGC